MKEIKYKPSPAEQAQEELATHLNNLLAGKLAWERQDVLRKYRKESKKQCLMN